MRRPTHHTADAIVIGAGIIGSACAYHLAERGLRVHCLEAAKAPGLGTTNRSAAGARVQFTVETNVRLSWASIQAYRDFEAVHGVSAGYRPVGYLMLVPQERWAEHLEGVAVQRGVGAPVEVLSLSAAQTHTRFDEGGLGGATFGPADGTIDPNAATRAYVARAAELGARLHLGAELLMAEQIDDVWALATTAGDFEAPLVINAAGPWAGEVGRRAGLQVPVVPVRRMVFASPPSAWQRDIPLSIDLGTNFYFRNDGQRLIMGMARVDEPPGFTPGVDWDWLAPTLEAGVRRFPHLRGTVIDRQASWHGYYEVTPDHHPLLGRSEEATGWIDACGFSGHGVQQAPAVGRVIAEEAVDGRARSIDIDAFRPGRFRDGVGRRAEHHVV